MTNSSDQSDNDEMMPSPATSKTTPLTPHSSRSSVIAPNAQNQISRPSTKYTPKSNSINRRIHPPKPPTTNQDDTQTE